MACNSLDLNVSMSTHKKWLRYFLVALYDVLQHSNVIQQCQLVTMVASYLAGTTLGLRSVYEVSVSTQTLISWFSELAWVKQRSQTVVRVYIRDQNWYHFLSLYLFISKCALYANCSASFRMCSVRSSS